jgi:hypothetical protein
MFGPSQPLGNGTVKTYVTLDGAGQPTEVGLRLSATAMDCLPQDTGPAQTVMLAFPDQAARTAFNHVYPTTYAVHVDQQTKDYVIALTGLTMHDAS